MATITPSPISVTQGQRVRRGQQAINAPRRSRPTAFTRDGYGYSRVSTDGITNIYKCVHPRWHKNAETDYFLTADAETGRFLGCSCPSPSAAGGACKHCDGCGEWLGARDGSDVLRAMNPGQSLADLDRLIGDLTGDRFELCFDDTATSVECLTTWTVTDRFSGKSFKVECLEGAYLRIADNYVLCPGRENYFEATACDCDYHASGGGTCVHMTVVRSARNGCIDFAEAILKRKPFDPERSIYFADLQLTRRSEEFMRGAAYPRRKAV